MFNNWTISELIQLETTEIMYIKETISAGDFLCLLRSDTPFLELTFFGFVLLGFKTAGLWTCGPLWVQKSLTLKQHIACYISYFDLHEQLCISVLWEALWILWSYEVYKRHFWLLASLKVIGRQICGAVSMCIQDSIVTS